MNVYGYSPKGTITRKRSFENFEEGIVGHFSRHANLHHGSSSFDSRNSAVIFAPGRTEFDAPEHYKAELVYQFEQDKNDRFAEPQRRDSLTFDNHRFQDFLNRRLQLPVPTVTRADTCGFDFDKRPHFSGAQIGTYWFRNGCLKLDTTLSRHEAKQLVELLKNQKFAEVRSPQVIYPALVA